jgi:cyclase
MTFRVCTKLEVKESNLIKGIQLEGLRVLGNVFEFASDYYSAGIDEILIIDVTSSWFSQNSVISHVAQELRECFVPLTIGGGLRRLSDVDSCLRSGAERVSLNTTIFENPKITSLISEKYGAQAVVFNLQARLIDSKFYCFTDNGRENTGMTIDEIFNLVDSNSIGEILLTSIDYDGTLRGVDEKLLTYTRSITDLPIMYSGGVSCIDDVEMVLNLGANAIAISSAFHYERLRVQEVKSELLRRGHAIRGIEDD